MGAHQTCEAGYHTAGPKGDSEVGSRADLTKLLSFLADTPKFIALRSISDLHQPDQ
jgi:hypothetical protein